MSTGRYTGLWSILTGPGLPGPLRTICIGAAIGGAVGGILESTGHSAFAMALLAACSIGSAYIGLLYLPTGLFSAASVWVTKRGVSIRCSLAVLLTAYGVFFYSSHGHNPQDYNYLSLLPTIVASAALFGFGPGLLAAATGVAGVDLIFGVPLSHVLIPSWKILSAVIVSSMLGAALAFGFLRLLSMYGDTIGD